MKIIFPDGGIREFEDGLKVIEVAKAISPSLAKKCVAGKLDENLVNLMRNISTNDILTDVRVKEYEALLTEIEYRRNDQLVGSKTR